MFGLGLLTGSNPPADRHLPSAPLDAPPDATVFAVIGDYGWGGADTAAVAALVHSWSPDFVITTGDNNYPAGGADTIDLTIGQHYQSFIAPYTGSFGAGAETNAFFPVLGNHDWMATDAQPYFDYFTLPGNERYYTLTRGPVQFFMLDSDTHEPDGIGLSSVQAAWAHDGLVASTAAWQIVSMHHPPYSSSAVHGSTPAMQWPYADWGADLVLAGHDHTYERLLVDGLTYVVNGAGGAPLYGFGPALPESMVRDQSAHGAQRCVATEVRLICQQITVDGLLVDTLTLSHPVVPHYVYLPSLRAE